MRIYYHATDTTANANYDLPTNYDSSIGGEWWLPPSMFSPPVLSEAEQRRRRGENPRARVGEIIWEKDIVR